MKDELKDLLFFSCLSSEQMDRVISFIKPVELNSGEILFKEGEYSNYVCFIISGSLEVIKTTTWQNLTTVIAELDEGSCIGVTSLINHIPRSATVRANKNTTLAIIDQDSFDTIIKNDSELGVNILKGIIHTISNNLQPDVNNITDKVAA